MATLGEVYRKFGEVFEVAQFLEHEMGTLLLEHRLIDEALFKNPNLERALEIEKQINNRETLGSLKNHLVERRDSIKELEQVLKKAVDSRNRLAHSFYIKNHCNSKSDEGRDFMLHDLEAIHKDLLEAQKAVFALSGIDIEKYDP